MRHSRATYVAPECHEIRNKYIIQYFQMLILEGQRMIFRKRPGAVRQSSDRLGPAACGIKILSSCPRSRIRLQFNSTPTPDTPSIFKSGFHKRPSTDWILMRVIDPSPDMFTAKTKSWLIGAVSKHNSCSYRREYF